MGCLFFIFHNWDVWSDVYGKNPTQQRTCANCGLVKIRRVKTDV